MRAGASARAAFAAMLALLAASPAWSQDWRASARLGRVTYEGAPTGASAASSAVLGLDRSGPRDWLGLSAAIPLADDPFWAVLGGWTRLQSRGNSGLLLDLTGRGFIQRQRTTVARTPAPGPLPLTVPGTTPVRTDLSGEGAGGEAMAGVFGGSPHIRAESRLGIAAQRSRLGDVLQQRALPSGDVRLSIPLAQTTFQAESRAWLDDSVTHGYLGGTLQYRRGTVQLWGSLGRWVAGGFDRTAWSVGAGAGLGPGLELQFGGRGNAFDPLYHSATATSWWGGLNLRLGGSRAAGGPVPARTHDGRTIIALPARAAKGTPAIAGDFTGWKPVPMERSGSRWIYAATLAPGVYHYAFVGEDGAWFVPKSVPGRQDDGMGGATAVLVVS